MVMERDGASNNVNVVTAPSATTAKKVIWLNAERAF
jgi:hypothetical protein